VAKTAGVFNLDTKGKCVTSVILRRFMVWRTYFDTRPDGFWNLRGRSSGTESTIEMRTAFFCAITQRLVVIAYRRFGGKLSVSSSMFLTLGDKLSWPLKMEPIGCAETSVKNCRYSLRNNSEERSSHLLCGGSLK